MIHNHHRPISSVDRRYNEAIWLWSWGGLSVFIGDGSVTLAPRSVHRFHFHGSPANWQSGLNWDSLVIHTHSTLTRERLRHHQVTLCVISYLFLPCSATVFGHTSLEKIWLELVLISKNKVNRRHVELILIVQAAFLFSRL